MITLRRVQKAFQTGSSRQDILRSVDLQIDPGEYVAIMGKSGSGKSTLLNILGALDSTDSGEYILAGKPVHKMRQSKRTALRNTEIGFVFQQFQLIPNLSVYQNVLLPLTYGRKKLGRKKARVLQLLEEVGLADKRKQKPSRLSGGEKQRAAIARALVNEPSILLADEPTGSLDEATTETILQLFDRVHQQGTTIVVITHDQEVADRAQRVIHLKDGVLA
ncbi:ABC transporter ATP-binding protein [Domibacillus indicus]|uniref:ABC transporter ATP-binding protein n=1 Tax=Domibacillus indicus TaxID=1437523 RepID=UPI00203BA380|nr:ABC transporter ATP-binding protein [Domibacillus indicus]MCM3791219.1 ABC transporter ATP-binding protein [Domibacillus indicus]